MPSLLKRILIGPPIASDQEQHQRLSKKVALPVFASDAVSSTAYATEEILIVFLSLGGVGMAAYSRLTPLAIMVIILLAIVVASYRQTLFAYPSGGGSYLVSKENLGETPALIAGSSLLVDYILTVAVSVSSGVAAIVSAFHGLAPYRVELCVGFILLMTVANLRGLKESGALFAPPTYMYIISLVSLIVVGLYRVYFQDLGPIAHAGVAKELLDQAQPITLFIFLKAFASGAVALSGVEAVSNGVPAFEAPEPKNASITLMWMAGILGSCFMGLSILAQHLQPVKDHEGLIQSTVLAQMAEHVYGGRNIFFFIMQFSTFGILILAANTAYADYPRLSSIIAKDGYLPKQFANRGDRLVFSNGVLFLSSMAIILVVVFHGDPTLLIPLYAVGVFTGFTLSQTGMVVHHIHLKEPNWRRSIVINAVGAVTTFLVAATVVVAKFTDGAWIPAALIPILMIFFKTIHHHYVKVKEGVAVTEDFRVVRRTHLVVVLVGSMHKGVLNALEYATSLAPDRVIAVSVVSDEEEAEALRNEWEHHNVKVELHTVSSPYRDFTGEILDYIDELDSQDHDDIVTVVIPEFVTSMRTQWLHNQSALQLKARLLYRPNTVVTSVPLVID